MERTEIHALPEEYMDDLRLKVGRFDRARGGRETFMYYREDRMGGIYSSLSIENLKMVM